MELDQAQNLKAKLSNAINSGYKDRVQYLLNQHSSFDVNDAIDRFNGTTCLHLAVKKRSPDIVDILLHRGADVNAKTCTDQTVLQLAFQGKNEQIIARFSHTDIDVRSRSQNKNTPLHLTVEAQNIEFTKIIIEKRADIDATNEFGLTPLHLAARLNNVQLVELLLSYGANIHSKTWDERVPLHLAVDNSAIEAAELLIKKGAGVNDRTMKGLTPIHGAVDTGNLDMVKLLVTNNADINAIGIRDETALNIAVAYERLEIAKYLISIGATVDHGSRSDMLLHMAAYNKNEKLVKLLLKHNADISVKYRDGRTALHVAADHKCPTIAEMLLKAGVDMDDRTVKGNTALHIAVENEDYETSAVLLSNKPNVDIKNNDKKTPLYIAAEKGFLNMVNELLNHKPDINKNESVLQFAVRGRGDQHEQIILKLLAYGFTIDFVKSCTYAETVDFMEKSVGNGHLALADNFLKSYVLPVSNNSTAMVLSRLLHLAVANDQFQIAKLLIDNCVDVNVNDNHDRKPLFYALKNGNLELTRLLFNAKPKAKIDRPLFFMVVGKGNQRVIEEFLNHYKNVNATDEFGTTALHFAAWSCDEKTIHLLFDNGFECKSQFEIQFSPSVEWNLRQNFGDDALDDYRRNLMTSPLHIASRRDRSDIVRALLDRGMDANSRDGYGRTALHVAAMFDNVQVIQVLMDFGADLYAGDESGYFCIDYAYNHENFMSSFLMNEVFSFIYGVDDIIGSRSVGSKASAKLLVKYLAAFDLEQGVVCERFGVVCERFGKYYGDCRIEIEELKNVAVFNNVTLYGVLRKSVHSLALCLRGENLTETCKLVIRRNKFPVYGDMLERRMKLAGERSLLMDEAKVYIANVLCLPDLVISKIMFYFSNRDLQCIKEAYQEYFS